MFSGSQRTAAPKLRASLNTIEPLERRQMLTVAPTTPTVLPVIESFDLGGLALGDVRQEVGQVNAKQPVDRYAFSVAQPTFVQIDSFELKTDARLIIRSHNDVIVASSDRPGRIGENLGLVLQPGRYSAEVVAKGNRWTS